MHMWTLPVWPALTFSNSSKNNSYICYTMSVFWTSNFADTDLLSVCDWGQFFIRDLWNTHEATLFKLNKSQNPFMRAQHGLSLIKCISQFKVRQETSIFLLQFYQNGCSRHMAEQWHSDLFVPSDLFLLSLPQSYEKPVMMQQLQISHLLQPFFFLLKFIIQP